MAKFSITGDFHGEIGRYGITDVKGRYLIVCGDYGFLFYPKGTMGYLEQQQQLDEIAEYSYTTLFVDGNHENFDILFNDYPVEIWNGGKVHRIRENVIHLMRGQVYDIEGTRFFTMGGAYSIDRYMRQEGYSFWTEELPRDEDYKEAIRNLEAVDNEVDVILSHTAPKEIIRRMGKEPDLHDIELTGFLEYVMYEVKFDKWFFGHWHLDREISDKFRALYFDVVEYGGE